MICIAICNLKGGSGKTTTVLSLGGAWALRGQRVLVIDMDPQADLTSALSADDEQLPIEGTVAALFEDGLFVSAERLIVPTTFPNLSLVRASELLRPVSRLGPDQYAGRQLALRAFVRDVTHLFDRVLIDNPPDLGFCAWSSMTAADCILTPVQANAKGIKGLRAVNDFVARVQRAANPELVQLGYVRTVFESRKNVHLTYSARIERAFPGMLLQEWFPKAAHFEDADAARQPVTHFKPRCAATKAVGKIVDEIENRLRHVAAVEPCREAA